MNNQVKVCVLRDDEEAYSLRATMHLHEHTFNFHICKDSLTWLM